ncbi:hypothetical protein QBC44DRAFT_315877 [Cladorrhinum sp. PSN332]|nr:hypothetical protein QBC44DRAFT_315877 [Cladorrhinum sp. PSN332]
MVSYGRRTRILTRVVFVVCLGFAVLQIRNLWFYSSYHYSEPHHHDHHQNSNAGGKGKLPQPPPPPRSQESVLFDLRSYWRKLTAAHGLESSDGDGVPVFVRRIRLAGEGGGGRGDNNNRGGLVKVKAPFLAPHGFTRPGRGKTLSGDDDDGKENDDDGGRSTKGIHFPLAGPLVVTVPFTSDTAYFKTENAHNNKDKENASESVLLATVTSYSRALELIPSWTSFLGRSHSNDAAAAGASLLVALSDGASQSQAVEVRDLLWQRGVKEVSVFVPEIKTDTDKGNVHAQLFQRMMMARFGVGELGVGGKRKKSWFGIIDPEVRFSDLGGLVSELEKGFGSEEDDDDNSGGNGRWYIGLPTNKGDWNNEGEETYGGGVVLMSPGVLDTAGQLMCFQGGGKGVKPADEGKKKWDEMLHECLMEGDRDLKFQVLVGEGGYLPSQDSMTFSTTSKPLVTKLDNNEKKTPLGDSASPMLFRDNWLLSSGDDEMTITYYPNGLEVKKVSGSTQQQGVKTSDRIVIHSPFPPETSKWRIKTTKKEKLVWNGDKKTWKLVQTEIKELGGGRQEIWQTYLNKKGVDEPDGEEKSDVDSVIILIWEVAQ